MAKKMDHEDLNEALVSTPLCSIRAIHIPQHLDRELVLKALKLKDKVTLECCPGEQCVQVVTSGLDNENKSSTAKPVVCRQVHRSSGASRGSSLFLNNLLIFIEIVQARFRIST